MFPILVMVMEGSSLCWVIYMHAAVDSLHSDVIFLYTCLPTVNHGKNLKLTLCSCALCSFHIVTKTFWSLWCLLWCNSMRFWCFQLGLLTAVVVSKSGPRLPSNGLLFSSEFSHQAHSKCASWHGLLIELDVDQSPTISWTCTRKVLAIN